MISTEDIIHETEMDKRIFISYLFPMVVRLLENIDNILTDLDNRTCQSRITTAENNLGLYITDIIGAMHLSLSIGYGKPEKYNNVFAFLAWHTLNLFALLGF